MKLLRTTLPASVLLAGCLAAPPNDTIAEAEEAAAEATDALAAAPPDDLPRWRVYQAGRDATATRHDPDPDTIDHLGAVVAIREGDENDRDRWVVLSLSWHWKQGDRYFVELMKRTGVSGTDLLVITTELLNKGAHLPPLPSPAKPRAFRGVEGGGDWSPFPGFPGSPASAGEDHTGGPVAGSPRNTDPTRPAQPHGGRNGALPKPAKRPPPRADGTGRYGVERSDPPPQPSPFDAGHTPRPNERQVTFKCEGRVYRGYRHACIDFQRMPDGVKWGKKLSGWTGRYFDPNNIAMMPRDRETLCKVALAASTFGACGAAALACVGAEVITVGSVTVPCVWLGLVLCGAHGSAAGVVDCKVVAN